MLAIRFDFGGTIEKILCFTLTGKFARDVALSRADPVLRDLLRNLYRVAFVDDRFECRFVGSFEVI